MGLFTVMPIRVRFLIARRGKLWINFYSGPRALVLMATYSVPMACGRPSQVQILSERRRASKQNSVLISVATDLGRSPNADIVVIDISGSTSQYAGGDRDGSAR